MKVLSNLMAVLLFMINISWSVLFFSYREFYKIQFKQSIKKTLSLSENYYFKVHKKDVNMFCWTKKGKEFKYEGKMFDIVSVENFEDSIVYNCIHDFKESFLYADLEGSIKYSLMDNGILQWIKSFLTIKYFAEYKLAFDNYITDFLTYNLFVKYREYGKLINKLFRPPILSLIIKTY